MQSILFESTDKVAIDFNLVKSIAALLRYIMLGQRYPIYTELMYCCMISTTKHCTLESGSIAQKVQWVHLRPSIVLIAIYIWTCQKNSDQSTLLALISLMRTCPVETLVLPLDPFGEPIESILIEPLGLLTYLVV